MKRARHPRRRKYSRKFSGKRTDTQIVSSKITSDGFSYYNRHDGSKYPKFTSIPVTESILRIYAILRDVGKYNNYDELLLDIAKQVVDTKRLPLSRLPKGYFVLNESIAETLEHWVRHAEINKRLRTKARKRASLKKRYNPRKTGQY